MQNNDSLKLIRDNFVDELRRATAGQKTSLPFIKSPLPQKTGVAGGEIFQVMVLGGSIFKSALVKKNNRQTHVISVKSENISPIKNQSMLFALFAEHLDPKVSTLAINFAFGLKPTLRNGLLDGQWQPTMDSKEFFFENLAGKLIGEELEKYLLETKRYRIRVTIANDTICLLLSTLDKLALPRSYKSYYVAGVIGSGINFAFFLDENTAVNLESGNFNRFEQSPAGKAIDRNSNAPGKHLFEKEVTGAYLYRHYNLQIKDDKHCLSSTKELSAVAKNADNLHFRLAQQLLKHSASLVACQVAGIYLYLNKPPQLNFIIEGSLFWDGYRYREYINNYLTLLEVPKTAVGFLKIKNSDIFGTANLLIIF